MGWTLQDVHSLDADDYRLLIAWINDSTSDEDGSIDMDAVISAKTEKDAQHGG